ncbi:hypothetical protein ACFYU8_17835 [Brevibacillus sp. NPDC003359]|uniref:hypothetical protein n=1 Tax=unclassified Brevibacillus TaxID=2684853 RepID=UPI00367B4EA1
MPLLIGHKAVALALVACFVPFAGIIMVLPNSVITLPLMVSFFLIIDHWLIYVIIISLHKRMTITLQALTSQLKKRLLFLLCSAVISATYVGSLALIVLLELYAFGLVY